MSLAHDLARQHGGEWRGDHAAIPTPGHSKRDRGTILRDRADGCGVLVFSFNADWRSVRDALGLTDEQARPMTAAERRQLTGDLAKARAEREGRQLARCVDLVEQGQRPEPGSPVWRYLTEARRIPRGLVAMAVGQGNLLEHRDEQGRVSMLAIAHNRRGVLRGVQLTKLRADGLGKRGAAIDRLTFGPYRGAACRLFKASDTLAVAEGTETALAFSALRKVPCWPTFGTRNLEAFEPPAGVRTIIIAADGDRADPNRPGDFKGLDAADALFERLRKRYRVIIEAAPDGLDWCDVLNRERAQCR